MNLDRPKKQKKVEQEQTLKNVNLSPIFQPKDHEMHTVLNMYNYEFSHLPESLNGNSSKRLPMFVGRIAESNEKNAEDQLLNPRKLYPESL